jgi:hypothetical protein
MTNDPVPGLPVCLVQESGAKILQPFGGIGENLFKSIYLNDNMPDYFALIGHKRAFTFGINSASQCRGIGLPPGNGVPEKLEYIVIHDPVHVMVAAICHLTVRTDIQQTAADQKPRPYHDTLMQALI